MAKNEKLSARGARLLHQVKKVILEEPLRIDMGYWLLEGGSIPAYLMAVPACQTVGCIAGWVVHLSREPVYMADYQGTAAGVLGISHDQADALFYVDHWPEDLKKQMSTPLDLDDDDKVKPQTIEYAKVVASRIDRFISSEGAE